MQCLLSVIYCTMNIRLYKSALVSSFPYPSKYYVREGLKKIEKFTNRMIIQKIKLLNCGSKHRSFIFIIIIYYSNFVFTQEAAWRQKSEHLCIKMETD